MCRLLVVVDVNRALGTVVGDIISVVPDSHVFSKIEDKSVWVAEGNDPSEWSNHYGIIDIPGVSVSKANKLLIPETRAANVLDPEFAAPDEEDRVVVLGPRKFHIDIESIPQTKRQKFKQDRKISVTKTQVVNFIANKRDDGDTVEL